MLRKGASNKSNEPESSSSSSIAPRRPKRRTWGPAKKTVRASKSQSSSKAAAASRASETASGPKGTQLNRVRLAVQKYPRSFITRRLLEHLRGSRGPGGPADARLQRFITRFSREYTAVQIKAHAAPARAVRCVTRGPHAFRLARARLADRQRLALQKAADRRVYGLARQRFLQRRGFSPNFFAGDAVLFYNGEAWAACLVLAAANGGWMLWRFPPDPTLWFPLSPEQLQTAARAAAKAAAVATAASKPRRKARAKPPRKSRRGRNVGRRLRWGDGWNDSSSESESDDSTSPLSSDLSSEARMTALRAYEGAYVPALTLSADNLSDDSTPPGRGVYVARRSAKLIPHEALRLVCSLREAEDHPARGWEPVEGDHCYHRLRDEILRVVPHTTHILRSGRTGRYIILPFTIENVFLNDIRLDASSFRFLRTVLLGKPYHSFGEELVFFRGRTLTKYELETALVLLPSSLLDRRRKSSRARKGGHSDRVPKAPGSSKAVVALPDPVGRGPPLDQSGVEGRESRLQIFAAERHGGLQPLPLNEEEAEFVQRCSKALGEFYPDITYLFDTGILIVDPAPNLNILRSSEAPFPTLSRDHGQLVNASRSEIFFPESADMRVISPDGIIMRVPYTVQTPTAGQKPEQLQQMQKLRRAQQLLQLCSRDFEPPRPRPVLGMEGAKMLMSTTQAAMLWTPKSLQRILQFKKEESFPKHRAQLHWEWGPANWQTGALIEAGRIRMRSAMLSRRKRRRVEAGLRLTTSFGRWCDFSYDKLRGPHRGVHPDAVLTPGVYNAISLQRYMYDFRGAVPDLSEVVSKRCQSIKRIIFGFAQQELDVVFSRTPRSYLLTAFCSAVLYFTEDLLVSGSLFWPHEPAMLAHGLRVRAREAAFRQGRSRSVELYALADEIQELEGASGRSPRPRPTDTDAETKRMAGEMRFCRIFGGEYLLRSVQVMLRTPSFFRGNVPGLEPRDYGRTPASERFALQEKLETEDAVSTFYTVCLSRLMEYMFKGRVSLCPEERYI